jgi:AraC-like DNA-binding protein
MAICASARTYGYYDQAHLVNDFREFAGVSPTTYLRLRDPSGRARPPFPLTEDPDR